MEYDFEVAAGADPSLVRMEYTGGKRLKIARNGDLIFFFPGVEIRHRRPRAFQEIDGQRVEIDARFVLVGKNQIGFEIGAYDSTKKLIIDPTVYASYLGGSAGSDIVYDIVADHTGFIYTALDLRTSANGETYSDVQITKWSSTGAVPIYTSTIGGAQDDVPYGIDVDDDGQVYITGITWSPNFPMAFPDQENHYIRVLQLDAMAFVTRLKADGDIRCSTFLGGDCPGQQVFNWGRSIRADVNENAYVTGQTCSDNFPLKNPYRSTRQGTGNNTFVTRYNDSLRIRYSTYFPAFSGIDIDANEEGIVYFTGAAGSGGIPLTPGAYQTSGAGYVASLNTNVAGSSSLRYCTYSSAARSIVSDIYGNVWAGGPSFQSLVKINPTGTALLASVADTNNNWDIALDARGNVYYVGAGGSGYLRVVARDPNGALLDETTFLTGNNSTVVWGLALGPVPGIVYLSGFTRSTNFPTTPDAYFPVNPNTGPFGSGFYARVSLAIEEPNPLIFVPGISGSTLFEANASGDPDPSKELWPAGVTSPFAGTLQKLSLDPADPITNVVAVDAVRTVSLPFYTSQIYKPLLDHLNLPGQYVEYQVGMNPKKRNTQCTGEFTGDRPTLFVFAYDWRKSSAQSASELADFVTCVRKFHPDKQVDILAHSMGGLVTRRYILDHPTDHHVSHVVTIASPFLGTPKAIDVLLTGRFVPGEILNTEIYYHKKVIKKVIGFAPGAHELLPSDSYFALGGVPFAYQKTLQGVTDVSYSEAMTAINSRYPAFPYNNSAQFHDHQSSAQDDWRLDSTGIKYLHLFGRQPDRKTIEKVVAPMFFEYPIVPEHLLRDPVVIKGRGDGTVTELSAKRDSSFWAPNTTVKRCATAVNDEVEHNGLTQQVFVWNEVHAFLNNETRTAPQCVETTGGELAESESITPTTRVDIHGVNRVEIFDEFGNTNTPIGYDTDIAVAGVEYEPGSDPSDGFSDPHRLEFNSGKQVDLKFVTTALTRRIQIVSDDSQGEVSTAVRYLDLQLPIGVTALLRFTTSGVESLKYDGDGNGSFETEVQPTFSLTGTAANDTAAPSIAISATVDEGNRTVAIDAVDAGTGVNQVRYIFQGETTDHIYSGPFTASGSQTGLVYVSAQDNAGNRAVMLKWLDVLPPVSSVNQTPSSNANGWNTSDLTFEMKAVDEVGGSGVETFTYSAIGSQPFGEEILERRLPPFDNPVPSTSTDFLVKTLTLFKEGLTTFTFHATDRAGNVESTKTHQVKIDKSLPISAHSLSSDGTQTTFTLTSSDVVSGVSEIVYTIDGGSQQTYTAPFVVSNTGGHVVTYFARDVAGNEETPRTVYVNPASVAKSVLISEFRTRGNLGADDEFIELYNNGDTPTDISGWSLSVKHGSVATPITLATINSGVLLPPRSHYLIRKAGTTNYSLASYAEADQTYTDSLGDNCGIKLISSSGVTTDAVGFASVTDATYREGTGFTPSTGISTNGQYSFARTFIKNLPVDSNNNKADFAFVATDGGTYNNLKAILGSPGPENLNSLTYREGDVLITQIDPNITLAEAPNRLFNYTNPPPLYPVGILSIRRKLTNNSGQTITQLKLRITTITTKNSSVIFPQQAQLRAFTSSDISVTSADGQTSIPVRGLSIETIPTTVEAGLNSSLTLDLGTGLAAGQSLNIDLKSGIVTNGQYKLEFRVEALKVSP